jgi:hypothetical protein
LNTKADLANPRFTGSVFSPIVNAFFLRENNVNISTIYETALNASTKYQIVDTNIQTLGQMIQRGNVVINGILQQETWNTTININRQLIVKTSDVSPIFPMLVSPTQITMNSTLHINSSAGTPCILNNTVGANANIDFRYLSNFWNVWYGWRELPH